VQYKDAERSLKSADGNLYGTDEFGGAYTRDIYGDPGCGPIFKITPTGQFTILYSFKGADGSACGDGTVFKITSTGMLTTLYAFCGDDGEFPIAPLIRTTDGNLYSTTSVGGRSTNCANFDG
jgi:uncharacterized repeat protein (TIGR03803 family)